MRWWTRLGFVVVLQGTWVTTARSAYAQDATASAADALFQSGKAAMDEGRLDVACERLRESFRLQAAVGTLLNLGACEEKRGHVALASQCFRDALAMLGDGDYRRAFAEERLEELKKRVAVVRLTVEAPVPPDVRLAEDDVVLGPTSLGIDLWIDPGDHAFSARAQGFESDRRTVRLEEGERRDIVFRLSPLAVLQRSEPANGARAPGELGQARHASKLGPYVTLGAGGAALVVGSVFGFVVMNAASEVRDHCDATGCDDLGLRAADRGRPYAVLSPVLLGAGAALVGAGIVWLQLSRSTGLRPSTMGFGSSAGASLVGTF